MITISANITPKSLEITGTIKYITEILRLFLIRVPQICLE
jgi:hypothetical protein